MLTVVTLYPVEIIKESVPVFEKASVDEFYADLSGMDRFFGCYKYASEMRQRILKETGLPIGRWRTD